MKSEADREDTSNWIIYKVPNKLRKIRPAAYTPQLVSIGPFHHGKPNLKAMEYYKTKYMEKFLRRRSCNRIKKEDLEHQFEEDGKFVEKVQRQYQEETFEPENTKTYRTDSKKYWKDPKNILRDACFILELFLRNHEQVEDEKKKQPDKEIKDDACFIFESYFRNHETQTQTPDKEEHEKYSGDYILKPWVKAAIKQDLILLENQLPFFVLTQLVNFIIKYPSINIDEEPKNNEGDPLANFLIVITCEFFMNYYRYGKPCTEENSFAYDEDDDHWKSEMKDIIHFTDLVRKFMYDKDDTESSDSSTLCLHSAKQLDNAGVTFGSPKDATYLARIKIWPDDKCCWWKGRGCCWINCLELKIPHLRVDDNIECIFRNVMALEQFVYPNDPRICSYIILLDQLIDTVEDVDLLVDKRIVENCLGSNKAVVDLVNKLNAQIVVPRFLYGGICDKLNKYHGKRLNVARSTLKRVYFKDIWTGSSTVVGLVFLVFSLFSTYSSIKNLFVV
nr:UPF0481 protein At3g47200-like [Ziziphus jujuba var. spinosa]